MRVDRDVPIPLYYQIADQLRNKVQTGELKPGQQIPPERELTELFDVSRMTVHQAITYLVRLGVLTVRRGAGTFVAEPKFTHDTMRVVGFEEEVARQDGKVTSVVLENDLVEASETVQSFLNLEPGAEVYKIVRVRKAWGIPLVLETSNIPAALCPGLSDHDFSSHSLFTILREEYGLEMFRTEQFLEAVGAVEYEARLLDLEPGSPLVLFDGVTYTAADVAVEYCRAMYRGDRFQFYARSTGTDDSSPLSLRLTSHQVSHRGR